MPGGRISEMSSGWKGGAGMRAIRVLALGAAISAVPVIAAAGPAGHREVRVPRVDRRAIENLQRWVNGGHDAWCKDAREVASMELRKVAPEFSGERFDLVSLPLEAGAKTAKKMEFAWSSVDGSTTYRVTVERFDWLKAVAGGEKDMVWVPSRVEIVRTESSRPVKRIFAEIPRA